jgi:hypothetical protein
VFVLRLAVRCVNSATDFTLLGFGCSVLSATQPCGNFRRLTGRIRGTTSWQYLLFHARLATMPPSVEFHQRAIELLVLEPVSYGFSRVLTATARPARV